ncbi:MAG: hypothetical protein PVJ67_04925 [Candidatus Pacearchaeota archaeon]|jgi:hypothetical protein
MVQERNLQFRSTKAFIGLILSMIATAIPVVLIISIFITNGFVQVISVCGLLLIFVILVNRDYKELKLLWSSGIHIRR